ncbi:hypothetical protein M917_1975 [Psychrobacter aquaticus CMS 56]|uniref:Uncharacterized protein n=1 Tax=Psychrobacter aquaticus CMS 56 TaxID=1354303 RepID=U4T2K5_9GAMM|nr:hypothetical protein M917_1975 [Psychrobacter aquaticus CMS 56]
MDNGNVNQTKNPVKCVLANIAHFTRIFTASCALNHLN